MLRTVQATRYVTPLREGGSLPAIVEADDLGMYVVKFRGAGQGPKALVAEVIGGQIGQALGLPVPDIVAVEIDPALGRNEPDPEIQDLIAASTGLNAGLDYLPGSLTVAAAVNLPINAEQAADIVWFDAYISNVDRTPRNPNLLLWHRKLWLIDHGASLYLHHSWTDPVAMAGAKFAAIREHILLPVAAAIPDADARLRDRLRPEVIEEIVAGVPDVWFEGQSPFATPAEHRAAYEAYLTRRLALSAEFVEEAERARRADHAG
jgi:hypothetical protein